MNVMVYFSPENLSNSYIVFKNDGAKALLIDPRAFDVPIFKLIESRSLEVASVLLTHSHTLATRAIKTIQRIYETEVYAGFEQVGDIVIHHVDRPSHFETASLAVEAIRIPGIHSDSHFYHIGNALFTGDALSAGTMAQADLSYGRAILIQQTREILAKLPKETVIFPMHGPPSTVGIELSTNIDLLADENPDY